MRTRVYKEEDHRLVRSSHGPNIYYRVFKGTVKWPYSDADLPAVVVLMQYGGTADWNGAVKEINFRSPAHILDGDLPAVLEAISELQGRNGYVVK